MFPARGLVKPESATLSMAPGEVTAMQMGQGGRHNASRLILLDQPHARTRGLNPSLRSNVTRARIILHIRR